MPPPCDGRVAGEGAVLHRQRAGVRDAAAAADGRVGEPPLTVALFRVRLPPALTARMRRSRATGPPLRVVVARRAGRWPSVTLCADGLGGAAALMVSAPRPPQSIGRPSSPPASRVVSAAASVARCRGAGAVDHGDRCRAAPRSGAPFSASSSAIPARLRPSWRCQRRRSARGRRRSRPYQAAKRREQIIPAPAAAQPLRAGFAGTSARACCQAAQVSAPDRISYAVSSML